MKLRAFTPILALLLLVATGCSSWENIAPGVGYRRISLRSGPVYVTRVDLDRARLIASSSSERNTTVTSYAQRQDALAAINGDYFDEGKTYEPTGIAGDACGKWSDPTVKRNEPVVAMGRRRVEIIDPANLLQTWPSWIDGAVAGWPLLVRDCRPLSSSELPGSDSFTRSDHPRTAVGLSRDGRTVYLVVVDGRSENAGGMTLSRLGEFLADRLHVCTGLNLDGGGSSEMVVEGKIVNVPSDGHERPVGNFVGVVPAARQPECAATK
ncbi:MAG: phosphodiester glycosidase family protein [Thermoanaerobaculia bacterium]